MPVRRRSLRRTLTAAALAAATTGTALAAAGPAHAATTWFVATTGGGTACSSASPCATVTTALTKALAGDTISVAAGSYADRPFVNKAVSIVGQGGGATFNGSASTTAGYALAVSTTGAVNLTNLTLTGGHYQLGGALPIFNGVVTATDVVITNNASSSGGGAFVNAGSLTMVRGSVTGNTATAAAANQGWGGGIYATANATLTLNGTTVADNTGDANGKGLGFGGGVLALGPATLTNATVRGNTEKPANNSYAGGLYAGGVTTVTGGAISGNTAALGGGVANAQPLTLHGVTMDGNTALAGGAVDALKDVTITGGSLTNNKATTNYGGAIYAAASLPLVLDGTTVTGNSAPTAGGALAVSGAVTTTIRNGSRLTGNTSQSGAAVWNAGAMTVQASVISNNDASYQGGAFYNGPAAAADTPSLTVTGSRLDNNTAVLGGGAVSNAAKATFSVQGGGLDGNSAAGGGALVIASGGTGSLSSTELAHNAATSLGGGAVLNSGKLQVTDSTLDANEAVAISGNNNAGWGGAILSGATDANATTQLTVRRSTISHNKGWAGSAIATSSSGTGDVNQTSISDSTVTGNTSGSTSGTFLVVKQPLSVSRSTITDNTAATTAGNASVFAVVTPATVGVAGSIISGNSGNACNVALTDGGHNLVSTGTTTCGLGAAQNPQLGALGANGGPTLTQVPGPASPALDAIAAGTSATTTDAVTGGAIALCGGTDQRGTARPQGARCDIGAVEADQTVPEVSGPATLDTTVGSDAGTTTYVAVGSPLPHLSATGLPAGLTLTDNGDGTASLRGTPTGPGGKFAVTITGTNEAGSGTETVTVVVRQAPALTGPSADTFTVGQAGGPDVFTQSGGYPAATLSADGALPGGVTFTPGVQGDTGTGTIAGTPAAGTGGVYDLTVRGTNGTGPDATWPFRLTVDEAPSLAGPAAATYTVGTQGSTDLTVGGFPAPTLTATGLPAGLATTAHGIAGTPAAGSGGEYDAQVTATNGIGADATHAVHVTVDEAPHLAGPQNVRMVVGKSSSVSFVAIGYPAATITHTGALPAGVSLVDNGNGTATLSGVPADAGVGSYPITLRASNGIGSDATYAVTIEVVPPVSITTATLPDGAVGQSYDGMVVASGGQAPYTFTVSHGSLPQGLTLGADGHITGTPTGNAGPSSFTVKVTDASGDVDTQDLGITIGKGATSMVAKPIVTVGTLLKTTTFSVTLTGGMPPKALAGQTVRIKAASTVLCTATTDASGVASCDVGLTGLVTTLLNLGVYAQYDGNAQWNGSVVGIPLLF